MHDPGFRDKEIERRDKQVTGGNIPNPEIFGRVETEPDTAEPCSLCGGEVEGFGNNPWPLKDVRARCCDRCNSERVIPARIEQVFGPPADEPTPPAA